MCRKFSPDGGSGKRHEHRTSGKIRYVRTTRLYLVRSPWAARRYGGAMASEKASRVRQRIRRNRPLDLTWRLGVLIVGWGVVAAGVAMLVFPGPGWAAIFVGFAILATEFEWAERLLDKVKALARRAARWAKDPRHRRLVQILTVGAVIAVIGGCWWYISAFGVPGFVQAVLDWF